MKLLNVFIIVLFSTIVSMAQDSKSYTMRVWSSGSYASYSVENVDSITFVAEDEFKPEEPGTTIPNESFFADESKVISALAGAYVYFQSFMTCEKMLEEMALDENTDYNNQITPSNTRIYNAWQKGYQAVIHLNLIISNLDNGSFSYDTNKYNLQAKSLRAITYYMMAQIWGEIPYFLNYLTDDEARNPNISNRQEIIYECYNFLKNNIDLIPVIFGSPTKEISSENIRPLMNEMAMYIDGKFYNSDSSDKSLILNLDNSDETYIIVDGVYQELIEKEHNHNLTADELANLWKESRPRYGVWTALKRLNHYKPINGMANCLLFPKPERELLLNPNLKQNEGY